MVHFATRCVVAVFIVCVLPSARQSPTAQGPVQITNDTPAHGQQLQAVRTAGRIILDGTLDDPGWSEAPTARNFTQKSALTPAPRSFVHRFL